MKWTRQLKSKRNSKIAVLMIGRKEGRIRRRKRERKKCFID